MSVDFELSPLGKIVWEDRYALKDKDGNTVEKDISETFQRVAKAIASKEEDPKKWEKKFYDIMAKRLFCPAGRILAHSGTHYSQLLNCFVLPFEKDSLEAIMTTAKNMAIVQKFGGGCIGGENNIITNKGPIPLKEIVEKTDNELQVLSFNPDSKEMEYCDILERHTKPLDGNRIFEIKFDNMKGGVASKMHASDWHPFFVFDGEKIIQVRADELKPGMAVIGSTDLKTDEDITGWFLGYIAGDGSIDPNNKKDVRLRIVDDSKECVARFSRICDVPYKISDDKRYKVTMWESSVYGKKAEIVKKEFGGYQTAATKSIPISIWEGSAEKRFSFLVGHIDADGWFNKEKKCFEVFTVSRRLAEGLVALAGSLGIRASSRFRKSHKENESDGWEIHYASSQFITDCIVNISAKHTYLSSGWVIGSVPLSSVWNQKLKEKGININTREAWRKPIEIGGASVSVVNWLQRGKTTRETAATILRVCGKEKLANAVLSSQIVKSSEVTGISETLYDLTISKNQTYVASDPSTGTYVVVHNTGFNYSPLRPGGSYVKGVNGRSCGVIGFLNMMSVISEVIEQGGTRRGANLGLLEVWHPDIWELISYKNEHNWEHLKEFIDIKDEERWSYFKFENLYKLQMYNVSVGISDEFLDILEKDEIWPFMWDGEEWELYTVAYKKFKPQKSADDPNDYDEKRFEVTANCDDTAIWKLRRIVPYPTALDKLEVVSRRKVKASEIWDRICQYAWADGCPGIMNLSEVRRMHNLEYTDSAVAPNPCLHGDSLMLTGSGLQRIKNLVGKKIHLWNGEKWVEGEVICTGIKPVYEMRLSNGMLLKSTLDHKIFDIKNNEIELGESLGYNIQRLKGDESFYDEENPNSDFRCRPYWGPSEKYSGVDFDNQENAHLTCLGFVFGDGSYHKASNRYKYVYIGENDGDVVESLFNTIDESLEESGRYDKRKLSPKFAKKCEELEFPPLSLPERILPDKVLQLPPNQICCFLRGLFSANGSVLEKAKRITYKSSCRELIDQLQIVLMALGIQSYVTINKSHDVKFRNGIYTCRENYDLNITSEDLTRFYHIIGFVQPYKNEKLMNIIPEKAGNRIQPKVVSIEYVGDEYVYDFKMPEKHYAFVNGLKVHNCGEQPLPAYGSCNLSSLILVFFVDPEKKEINYPLLKNTIHTAVRFADNVIDICEFPIPEIKKKAYEERRIGLGTMGVHDMLIALELGYDTEEGRKIVEEVLKFIRDETYKASIEIAKEKGSFPKFNKDKHMESGFIKTLPENIQNKIKEHGIRNGTLLSQAPTGTIGTLHNVSTGCEPWYSLSYQRNTRLGSYEDGCPAFLKWKEEHNDHENIPDYFKTAPEIKVIDHVKMMALFSKYIDSAVSKTINLPSHASVDDVKKAFLTAMASGIKGLTIFREESKEGVLVSKNIVKEAKQAIDNLQNIKSEIIDSRISPKKRGNRVEGATYRVHMQNHNLYITANRNKEDSLVEVFATVGESKKPNAHHTSGVEDSWAEGLGKIISLALRAGVHPEAIIRNLKNIPSDKPVFTTVGSSLSELVPSPPHAIGRVIEEELKILNQKGEDIEYIRKPCDECGSTNTRPKSPTCYECLDCFHVSCG